MERDDLSERMLSIAYSGTWDDFLEILEQGANIHYIEPKYGQCLLHRAAGSSAFRFIKAVIELEPTVNFLVKDHKGRFPSAIAMEISNEPELAQFLMEKEMAQAAKLGEDYQALLTTEGRWSPPLPGIG